MAISLFHLETGTHPELQTQRFANNRSAETCVDNLGSADTHQICDRTERLTPCTLRSDVAANAQRHVTQSGRFGSSVAGSRRTGHTDEPTRENELIRDTVSGLGVPTWASGLEGIQ